MATTVSENIFLIVILTLSGISCAGIATGLSLVGMARYAVRKIRKKRDN